MDIPINQVIHTRRKTVALIIKPDGTLLVRAPLRLSRSKIQTIVNEKADWIRRKQAEILQQLAQQSIHTFTEGEKFLFLGQAYPLKFLPQARAQLELHDGVFLMRQDLTASAGRVFENWYKSKARKLFAQQVTSYAAIYGLLPSAIRLSAARTRWGSCNSHGVIRLAWRLIMAPPPVIDYVIVHELVHLSIPNHSKIFWSRVQQIIPDYQNARAWLKTNGHQLKIN